jgi:pyruvate ferredoxin oxidoreductase gamma subunit
MLGSASALSSGLAAAAAAMAGIITRVHLVEALREEFTQLGLEREETERNVQVGERVFAQISPVEIHPPSTSMKMEMATVSYDNPLLSTPSVLHAGNAEARPTGTWRVERPVIDPDICTRCGLCFVRCPDGAIALDEDGFPVIDYDHCKGCMICQQICPLRAIESRKETRAW